MGSEGGFGKHRTWVVHAVAHNFIETVVGCDGSQLSEALLTTSEEMLEALLPTSQSIIGSTASNIGSIFFARSRQATTPKPKGIQSHHSAGTFPIARLIDLKPSQGTC